MHANMTWGPPHLSTIGVVHKHWFPRVCSIFRFRVDWMDFLAEETRSENASDINFDAFKWAATVLQTRDPWFATQVDNF